MIKKVYFLNNYIFRQLVISSNRFNAPFTWVVSVLLCWKRETLYGPVPVKVMNDNRSDQMCSNQKIEHADHDVN